MEFRVPGQIPNFRANGDERLARLADFLCTLPEEGKLTFSRWYDDGRGCAVGLAAGEPWFRAQGLRLERDDSLKDCQPKFNDKTDWRAVMSFFDITLEEARELFSCSGYDGDIRPNPQRVAHKIRSFLRRRPARASDASQTAVEREVELV